MGNRSKNKGKNFEEKVAKIFRDCWNLSKHECHRALSSGTYQVDYSDIVFSPETIERPHLIVECKKRSRVSANQLLTFTSEFGQWQDQLFEASRKYFKQFAIYPLKLLVFAVNNMKPLVIIEKEWFKTDFSQLNLHFVNPLRICNFYIVNRGYVGLWLEEFLNHSLSPIYKDKNSKI